MIEGKRKAVIVGINNYNDNKNFSDLKGAENDATELCARLRDPEIGNFDISDTHFLTGQKATHKNIRKAIGEVFFKKENRAMALFYFSGHGFYDSYSDMYLAPCDVSHDNPFACGIKIKELRHIISRSYDTMVHNQCVIMILDCCYSGAAISGAINTEQYKSSASNEKHEEYIEILSSAEGIIILTSSEADEKSREIEYEHKNGEKHYHGAFTASLIEGLDGEASDESGIIYLGNLYDYAKKKTEGKQKSVFFREVGSSGINNIGLATCSRKYINYMAEEIKKTENHYNNFNQYDDLPSLINAIKKIHSFKRIDKNPDAKDLKDKCCSALDRCNKSVLKWVADNEPNLGPDHPAVFSKITDILNSEPLTCKNIAALSQETLRLLIPLYKVSKDKMSQRIFIEMINT